MVCHCSFIAWRFSSSSHFLFFLRPIGSLWLQLMPGNASKNEKKNVKFIDCTVEWKTKTGAPYFFFRVDAGHLCSNYSHHYHSVDVRTHLIVLHIRTKIHWDQTIKIEQWPSSVPPYSAFHGVHTKCAYRMRSTSSSTRQHQHSIQFYRFNCFISNDRVFPSISCFDRTVCKVTLRSCRAS